VAAPTIRNTTAASNAGGSLAVTKPSGLAVGDYLIAWHISDNDGALASMGAPAGWTLLGSNAGTTGGHPYQKVWTKVATSTETAASTFTFTDSASGIHNSAVVMAITTGTYDSTSPTTAVSFNNGGTSSSTSHVAPSVTGVVDGLLCTSHGTDSGGTAATYTAPSGMTERADTNGGSGSYTALEVATLALASTSATGSKTATCSTSRPWKGSALIVNPAAAPATALGVRTNLADNPALKTNATGWTGPSGWARSTSVDAGLPRTTGFEGSTVGDVAPPRAAVTAGSSYYWAVYVKAIVAQSGTLQVQYYDAPSGGTLIGTSGTSVPLSAGAGTVVRYVLGPYTVPTGATHGYLKLGNVSQGEITGYQVELASTFGAYFDGDSTGATWNGTSGNSTSTVRQSADAVAVAENFSIVQTIPADAKLFTNAVAVSALFTIAASGNPWSDSARVRDSFLITSLEWDEDRGRNRISAFTWAADVTSVRVSRRRTIGGGAWELVRGGTMDVLSGYMTHPVDDYEFPSGVDLDYQLEGITNTGAVAQVATIRRTSMADSVWLKFITSPALNRRLEFMGRGEITRSARTAIYDVQGRSDPVVVSDVHSSRRMTIRCKTETPAEAAALDYVLRQGLPCYVQVPETINTPSMYAVIGDYQHEPPALRSQRSVFTIPLVEVAAPPPSVVSPRATWAQLLTEYATWDQVLASVSTWRETAD